MQKKYKKKIDRIRQKIQTRWETFSSKYICLNDKIACLAVGEFFTWPLKNRKNLAYGLLYTFLYNIKIKFLFVIKSFRINKSFIEVFISFSLEKGKKISNKLAKYIKVGKKLVNVHKLFTVRLRFVKFYQVPLLLF